ncbi:hypothetical protein [Arenimonas sp. SCN 70-307]|uniref:hypothetical protein n=1 Tax=Arenimonas sp. SCN 70-307 TaxID=1660089 RepID=UPI0025C1BDBD|nr:hypothetical protein [Arenimonas sp. SCN 70-307]
MENLELKNALKAYDQAKSDARVRSIAVWEALVRADPEIAEEILRLFATVEAAADWATSDLSGVDRSPAHQVAEGRSAEVLIRLRRATHGFSA